MLDRGRLPGRFFIAISGGEYLAMPDPIDPDLGPSATAQRAPTILGAVCKVMASLGGPELSSYEHPSCLSALEWEVELLAAVIEVKLPRSLWGIW